MDQPAALVAREPELAALAAFLGSGRRALLLTGAPGIGKTTLWEAGIARARAAGSACSRRGRATRRRSSRSPG